MANSGLQSYIRGMREARNAFKALPQIVQDRIADASEETAERVRAGAVRRVPVRYGFLRDHIAKSVSRKMGTAKVGITKGSATTPDGKTVEPTRYAHLVEFGSVVVNAQPFMVPALEDERMPYLSRCREAGAAIERDVASIGVRNL